MDHSTPGSASALERSLYRSFLLLTALILFCSLGIALLFEFSRQRKSVDAIISGAAAYIASLPEVSGMLSQGYPDPGLQANLDSLSESIPDLSVIVICDRNGVRYYHTDRQKTGETFVSGEEADILAGSGPYLTTGYGTMGLQRRAFHAVTGPDHEILGFVMASIFTSAISDQFRYVLILNTLIFILAMAGCVPLAHAFIARMRRSLLGFEPDELTRLYVRQDELINSIDEGLITTDREGVVRFANETARRLLPPGPSGLAGQPLERLFPGSKAREILGGKPAPPARTVETGGHTLLVRELPVRSRKKQSIEGVAVLLLDRTEFLNLTDQLSGARNMLDTLQAFNHEFLNKLHIILGYLQTGQIQRAMDFITNSRLVSSQAVRETANCIRSPGICALVIGKMMHAAQSGIRLTILPGSCCLDSDLLLPADSCATILGNLLENAIEELAAHGGAVREIRLGLFFQPDCNLIVCEDTGGGIAPDIRGRIFEQGVSSKGTGRGTGLSLVSQITGQYGGTIEIETEPGEGTCFTLTFTKGAID